jgi:hypothetical protein
VRARRWVTWLAALVALTWAGDRALSAALAPLVLRSEWRFSRLYRGGLTPDVVVLGNSRGVNAFYAPRLSEAAGVRVWNLSYNGMSSELAAAVFEDYVEHNRAPRVLVLEVTSVYSAHEAVRDLRLYRRFSPRLAELNRLHDPRGAATSRLVHLYDYNNELFGRTLYYLGRSDQSWINRGRIAPEMLASVDTLSTVELRLPEGNLAALERLVRRAREAGIRVELVISPFLPAYRARIGNYEEWKETLSEALGGARIEDFSTAVTDVDAFGDRIHLNQLGSELLLPSLLAAGIFDLDPAP